MTPPMSYPFAIQNNLAIEAGQQLPGSRQESTLTSRPTSARLRIFLWRNRGAGNVDGPSEADRLIRKIQGAQE